MNDNFHSFYTKIGFDFREDYWCSSDMDGTAHEPGCCQPLDKSAPFFRHDFKSQNWLACSWEGKLEKSMSWKVLKLKVQSWKVIFYVIFQLQMTFPNFEDPFLLRTFLT